MLTLYRGESFGSYWHKNDATALGGFAAAPAAVQGHSVKAVVDHIGQGIALSPSPYLSLTRSEAVARCYALLWGTPPPKSGDTVFVETIELQSPLPYGLSLYDPVEVLAAEYGIHQRDRLWHDGMQNLLHTVIDKKYAWHSATTPWGTNPPAVVGMPAVVPVFDEFEALAWAMRDAEILALGPIPVTNNCSITRRTIVVP